MSASQQEPILPVADVFRTLRFYKLRWLLPMVLITAVVGAYAAWKPDVWEASQAITVRNEASTELAAPGEFRHDDEMKTTQETILQQATSRTVLAAALAHVGPPAHYEQPELWPTAKDVDLAQRESISLGPPKGAEFGKTEIFYLKVKDRDHQRAIALATAMCNQLEISAGQLRDDKAGGVIDELSRSVALAEASWNEATGRLADMEHGLGGDLSELRVLHQSPSGNGDLSRSLTDARNELQKVRESHRANRDLLKVLEEAQGDPRALVAAPALLLESQPSLKRLKDGLADSQLRTAELQSNMTDEHPQLVAARHAEAMIHENIVRELSTSLRGVEAECILTAGRLQVVEEQVASFSGRLDRLASVRAKYSNLANQLEHRRALLEQAESRLADAKAGRDAARRCSLISRVDLPEVGSRPHGPGRTTIAACGLAAGVLAGLGIVFLTAPPLYGGGRSTKFSAPQRAVDRVPHHEGNGFKAAPVEPQKAAHERLMAEAPR